MAEDIDVSIGLDDSTLLKDLRATKKKLQDFKNEIQSGSGVIEAKLKVNTKQATTQVNDALKAIDAEIKKREGIMQLAQGSVKGEGKVVAQRIADEKSLNSELDKLGKQREQESLKRVQNELKFQKTNYEAEQKTAQDKANLRAKEDAIYNDYLSKQTAGIEKANAKQAQIYNDYLNHQHAAKVKSNDKIARAEETARAKELAALQKNIKARADLAAAGGAIANPSLRYALYDISNSMMAVSAASFGAVAGVTALAASYESSMSNIERTTQAGSRKIELLKFQFQELAQQIPLSFAQLTDIGAIGAQMGIADSELAGFTKTVAMFAATTNVSIDSAAQAFGTIGELLNILPSQYANLGSAIAFVGINSNATESQVISVAEGIAGVGAQAGVSSEYVIGLAGTLASLGLPAEQSRGALTRIFQEVNRSAAEGGDALQNFANIVGMSATDLQALLKQDGGMEKFFTKFTEGLSGLDAQGLTATLDTLGLADVRVTNVLARLSQNTQLFSDTLADAKTGMENSALLSQLFSSKLEDLSTKFQLLINSLSELGSSMGEALLPTIGAMIDGLTETVQLRADFAVTDVGRVIVQIASVLAIVIGSLAAFTSGVTLAVASVSAFKWALGSMGLLQTGQSLTALMLGFLGVGTGATAGTIALNVFKLALAGTGIGLAVLALGALSTAFMNASLSSDQAFKNMISDTSGLADALKTDAAAYKEALASGNQELIDTFTVVNLSAEEAKNKQDGYSDAVINMGDALDTVLPSLSNMNAGFEDSTRVVGEATRKWITSALLASTEFQKLFESSDFTQWVDGINLDLGVLIDKQAAGATQQELLKYLYDLQMTAIKNGIKVPYTLENKGGEIKIAAGAGGQEINKLLKSLGGLTGAYYLAGTAASDVTKATDKYTGANDGAAGSADNLAEKIRTVVDYANDLSTVFKRAFDVQFGPQIAEDKFTKLMMDYEKTIADARKQVKKLESELVDLEKTSLTAFSDTYVKEFASKLKEGLTRVFSTNFAKQDAIDNITSSVRGMQKALEESRQSLADFQAQLAGLESEKATKEYFLSIAVKYGDTLRADALRAELQTVSNDISRINKDIANEASNISTELVGNSDAAIKNRATLSGLVKGYQDYIGTLVDGGASNDDIQKELKNSRTSFLAQAKTLGFTEDKLAIYLDTFNSFSTNAAVAGISAYNLAMNAQADAIQAVQDKQEELKIAQDNASTSLEGNTQAAIRNREYQQSLVIAVGEVASAYAASGYSADEVAGKVRSLTGDIQAQYDKFGLSAQSVSPYVSALNGLITVINNVPRNITAGLEIRGIDPALAAVNEFMAKARAAAGSGISAPISVTSTERRRLRIDPSDVRLYLQALRLGKMSAEQYDRAVYEYYADGGYVSGPGTATSDSINAKLSNGEYVIQASAVRQYGVGFFNNLNQMKAPQYFSGGTPTKNAVPATSTMMVELSPYDRNLLAQVGNIQLRLDGKVVAQAANSNNFVSAQRGSN